ncbi:hypothetical protein D3C80_1245920 [compost metagenome]
MAATSLAVVASWRELLATCSMAPWMRATNWLKLLAISASSSLPVRLALLSRARWRAASPMCSCRKETRRRKPIRMRVETSSEMAMAMTMMAIIWLRPLS